MENTYVRATLATDEIDNIDPLTSSTPDIDYGPNELPLDTRWST